MSPRVRTPAQVQAVFDRALAKSAEQAAFGNLPRLIRAYDTPEGQHQTWAVASRRQGGAIYLLNVLVPATGGVAELECDCRAHGWCWHRTHLERALAGQIPHYTIHQPVIVAPLVQRCPICGRIESAVAPDGRCAACLMNGSPRVNYPARARSA
jgi:hypothetical protein